MLYRCFNCMEFELDPECPHCDGESAESVPLDPVYYPEFQYRSKGLIRDLLGGRREKKELQATLDRVLEKYHEFEAPYFQNYFHLGHSDADSSEPTDSWKLRLFGAVLVRLGFNELEEFPDLLLKLVRTTSFRFIYADFDRRAQRHMTNSLRESLESWISESGTAFRRELPLFLHHRWAARLSTTEAASDTPPLLSAEEYARVMGHCERAYFEICVDRFQDTLEGFDSSLFVTIFGVDAMDGYEFEDFLSTMFSTLGYQVEQTRKGPDQGADLFVERFGRKIVIQAKNYSENVGNSAVQQALSAKAFYGCDSAMVVCNQEFTPSAKDLAKATEVTLVGRRKLQDYLDDYNRAIMENTEAWRVQGHRGSD